MSVLELRAPATTGVGLHTYAAAARVADVLLMLLSTTVAWSFWPADPAAEPVQGWSAEYLSWAIPTVLIWYVVLEAADAYEHEKVGGAVHELKAVVVGTAVVAAGMAISAYLFQLDISRASYLLAFGFGLLLLLLAHGIVRELIRRAHCRGMYMRPVVAVGRRRPVEDLVSELERSRYAGLQVVAACVPDEEAWEPIGPVPWVFPTSSLREVVKDSGASHVFLLSGAGESPRHTRRIAWALEGTDTQLAVVPHLTDIAGGRIRPRPVAGLPVIELEQPQLSGLQSAVKRIVDIAGSAVGLVLLSPLFAVLGFLIKREDGGPVFYKQTRVGIDGAEFGCYKFRSMHVDADRRVEELRARNEGHGVLFKMKDDPRVTRIGRFIRKYSLDELPQLINVLRGEMSLVGPRPALASEVEKYHSDLTRRLKVRPGMTGLWQVSGRSDLTAEESERLDLYYVDNWSMTHDVVILWKTIRVVLTGSGAY